MDNNFLQNLDGLIFFWAFIIGGAIEIFLLFIALIKTIKDNYWYGRKTSDYLSGERIEIIKSAYPYWKFTPNISKSKIASIGHKYDLSWAKVLYSTGVLENIYQQCKVMISMFVTVSPGKVNSSNEYESDDTIHFCNFVFEIDLPNCSKLEMPGIITGKADSFGTKMFDSMGRFFSDLGERKKDMNAAVSGCEILKNGASVTYSGVPRGQWESAVSLGLLNEIEEIYSTRINGKIFYCKGKLCMQAGVKMSDVQMYKAHNDFATDNPKLVIFTAEKLVKITKIIYSIS